MCACFGTVRSWSWGYARVSTTKQDLDRQVEASPGAGLTRSALDRHLPTRETRTLPLPRSLAARSAGGHPPPPPAGGAGPSCGHQPASHAEIHDHRAEMAILWLHLDGGRVAEAHHCATCQPHDHVIDVACADCGDGPLVTGQPPDLGDRPVGLALAWLRGRCLANPAAAVVPRPRHLTAPYYQHQRHRREPVLCPLPGLLCGRRCVRTGCCAGAGDGSRWGRAGSGSPRPPCARRHRELGGRPGRRGPGGGPRRPARCGAAAERHPGRTMRPAASGFHPAGERNPDV